jgi:hypothetical protein
MGGLTKIGGWGTKQLAQKAEQSRPTYGKTKGKCRSDVKC